MADQETIKKRFKRLGLLPAKLALYFGCGVAGYVLYAYLNKTGWLLWGLAGLLIYAIYDLRQRIDVVRPRYRCTFRRDILDAADRYGPVARLRGPQPPITLPFAPYPGLEINVWVESKGQRFMTGKIAKVVWDDISGGFSCTVAPEGADLLSVVESLEQYAGWHRNGPIGGLKAMLKAGEPV